MKNILHIYKSYFPDTQGGIEQFIRALSHATNALDYHNTLLTTSNQQSMISTTIESSALSIIRAPTNFSIASCPFSLRFYQQLKVLCQTYRVLHLHFPWPFGECAVRLLASSQANIIITYHADITRQKFLKWLYHPLMHHLLKRANYLVATSENQLHSSPILQRYKNKTQVIPLALDLAHYPILSANRRQHWYNQVGDNFLLFIGQFRYYKGIDVLLKALSRLPQPVTCVLAGDGPLKTNLQNLAKQLNLHAIHFVGAIDEVDKVALIELSRGLVLPSILRSEAFGLALLEGLAYGKPLISTELGTGTSFVNQEGVTGYVVPPNDPVALSVAINQLFQADSHYAVLQQGARIHFQKHFQLAHIAQQYHTLYQALDHSS